MDRTRDTLARSWTAALVAAGTLAAAPNLLAAQDAADPGCYLARGTLAEAAERSSPLDSASVELGGEMAKICWGAPAARDRVVMGDLVPYDEPWRTGANEATGLHLEFPAEVAGIEVPAGSYSLYTVPGETEWVVFLSTEFERWGIPIAQSVRAAEVGEARVPVTETDDHVEQLTFSFERTGEESAHLILEWERARVEIPIRRTEG